MIQSLLKISETNLNEIFGDDTISKNDRKILEEIQQILLGCFEATQIIQRDGFTLGYSLPLFRGK